MRAYYSRLPKEAVNKSLKWNFFTFAFGIVTLIIMWVINLCVENYGFMKELSKQVADLIFLYLATGITTSIALDYYFIKNKRKIPYNSYIYGFAIFIFFIGTIIITLSLLESAEKLQGFQPNGGNEYIQLFTLGICVLFSFIAKTFMFTLEK